MRKPRRGLDGRLSAMPVSMSDVKDNYFLRACRVLSLIVQLFAALSVVANVATLAFAARERRTPFANFVEICLRAYTCAMGGVGVLVEAENAWILSQCRVMESWLFRGSFTIFVGICTLHSSADGVVLIAFYREVVGVALVGAGLLYSGLGLLCFKQLKTSHLMRIRRAKLMKQELAELSQHKQQLETLLAATETKIEAL